MDYKVYQITKKEMFRYAAVYILADVLISLLFYRSVLAAVVFLPGICFFSVSFSEKSEENWQRKEENSWSGDFWSGCGVFLPP